MRPSRDLGTHRMQENDLFFGDCTTICSSKQDEGQACSRKYPGQETRQVVIVVCHTHRDTGQAALSFYDFSLPIFKTTASKPTVAVSTPGGWRN